ncbi:MAG: aspartate-semialdehyde dehydrogenase [Candidatus Brocadiia bacterium]
MNSKSFKVGVVGAGMVGEELVRVLEQRAFPAEELRIMARSERTQELAGNKRHVIAASEEVFDGLDVALFAGTEGESGASQLFGWKAVKKGVFVVDNGSDFRMDPRVPLVIPEVNPKAMEGNQGFIANPNCSTIQMVVALAPLHEVGVIRRIVISTYQAVSGTGRAGVRALREQRTCAAEGIDAELGPYPHQIYDNCLPEIGSMKEEYPGYYSEEVKMIKETRKILGEPEMPITATCVRVPVSMSHSETINVEFENKMSSEQAREILAKAPGVEVVDDPASHSYPLAREASGKDPVYVGRIRRDPSRENTLDMWCVSDNIRKGAALNTVQIAEKAIEMGIVE